MFEIVSDQPSENSKDSISDAVGVSNPEYDAGYPNICGCENVPTENAVNAILYYPPYRSI